MVHKFKHPSKEAQKNAWRYIEYLAKKHKINLEKLKERSFDIGRQYYEAKKIPESEYREIEYTSKVR